MSLDPELADLLVDEVTFRYRTGLNNYGEPTFATRTVQSALVQWEQAIVRTDAGEEVTAQGVIYMDVPGWWTPSPNDEVTLPGSVTRNVLAVELHRDERGDHHYQIRFD